MWRWIGVVVSVVIFTFSDCYAGWFEDYKKKEISLYYPTTMEKIAKKFPALQFFDEYAHLTTGIVFVRAQDRKTKQKYFLWNDTFSFGLTQKMCWHLGKTKEWTETGIRQLMGWDGVSKEDRDKNIIKIGIIND